jgi:hypothetical protein
MLINQQVSAPTSTASDSIASPSFSNRSFQTQITVQDGDTFAIGGFITESTTDQSIGIPFLSRIPILGAAFGGKSKSTSRDELIVCGGCHRRFESRAEAHEERDERPAVVPLLDGSSRVKIPIAAIEWKLVGRKILGALEGFGQSGRSVVHGAQHRVI